MEAVMYITMIFGIGTCIAVVIAMACTRELNDADIIAMEGKDGE